MEIKSISHLDAWPIRHQVMWPNREIDYVKLPEDEQGRHFGLFVDNQLVSVVSVFIGGEEAQFRKFATLENFQGNGYGSQLLQYVFDWLRQQAVNKIWCNARVNKTGFYEKFGMSKTDKTFEKGGKDYVVMECLI